MYNILYSCFKIFALLYLFLLPFTLSAEKETEHKDSIVKIPTDQKLNEYREKNAFQYDENYSPPQTFWQKISYYISKFLQFLFGSKGIAPYIRWAIFLALVVILIVKLINAKFSSLFYSTKNKNIEADIVFNEKGSNLEDINDKINTAIRNENYREATRLLYVKVLKKMSLNELIDWEANKTNNDFRNELLNTLYEKPFAVISYWFEYVWYGKFPVDNSVFEKIKSDYNTVFELINEKTEKK